MSPADLHSFFVSRIQVCRAWHCWWVAGISPQVGDLQQSEVPPATKQSWKSIYPKACCGKQKCHAISRFPRKRNQGHYIPFPRRQQMLASRQSRGCADTQKNLHDFTGLSEKRSRGRTATLLPRLTAALGRESQGSLSTPPRGPRSPTAWR